MSKKSLLVTASTYPRWKNDTVPPFVQQYSQRMTAYYDTVHVAVPHFKGAKTKDQEGSVKIKRFRYAWPASAEDIVYGGGGVFKIKKSPVYAMKLLGFVLSEFFSTLALSLSKNVDVVNAHWIIPQGFLAVCAKFITGKKVVISVHGSDILGLKGKLMTSVKRFVLRHADYVIANSPATLRACQDVYPKVKAEVIPMGIDLDYFKPGKKPANLVKKHQLKNTFTILFLGRLTTVKGVNYLLEAVDGLARDGLRFKLLIAGDGPEKKNLQAYVQEHSLEEYVEFIGWIDSTEVVNYYHVADVFAGPSLHEALGLVFVEAQASGVPVVASDVDGIPGIVADGETGFLVDKKSSDQLYAKLKTLYNNPKLLRSMSDKAPQQIADQYSWETVAKKYADVFSRLER
ncbi:MAG TPA: glycosyltransferase [Candidatus Saccharimonadales bacterium]|nr:glycosyltransferase [Candidatus Saccharimonadales bacterium]